MFCTKHFFSVPFRDSVLTKLLKNALGGNSKTIMVSLIAYCRKCERSQQQSSWPNGCLRMFGPIVKERSPLTNCHFEVKVCIGIFFGILTFKTILQLFVTFISRSTHTVFWLIVTKIFLYLWIPVLDCSLKSCWYQLWGDFVDATIW